MNKWKVHNDWHFSGLATAFSCEGHRKNKTYVSFHSSRLVAHRLEECLDKYKNKDKWKVEFSSNGYLLEMKNKTGDNLKEVKKLAHFLITYFFISENDPGWRAFPLPRRLEVYGISEVFSEPDGEEMMMSVLDYILGHGGEIDEDVLKKSMEFKFGEWEDTYKSLMKYGLIEVNGSKVSITLDIKESLWQMVVKKIENKSYEKHLRKRFTMHELSKLLNVPYASFH